MHLDLASRTQKNYLYMGVEERGRGLFEYVCKEAILYRQILGLEAAASNATCYFA